MDNLWNLESDLLTKMSNSQLNVRVWLSKERCMIEEQIEKYCVSI